MGQFQFAWKGRGFSRCGTCLVETDPLPEFGSRRFRVAPRFQRCHKALFKRRQPLRLASRFVNHTLLSLQAACQLFAVFHLPTAPLFPSIQIESWPAGLVMTVTDF